MNMQIREVAIQMLQAYADLNPAQQIEVLRRVWEMEDPAGKGVGKAILLSILTYEAFGVPTALIPPESVVEAVTVLSEMAERLKSQHTSDHN
jgi:hypothetical protein